MIRLYILPVVIVAVTGFGSVTGAKAQSFWDKFKDPDDGAFDISSMLASRTGFLPVIVPVTEPAVGFGAAGGVSYFHQRKTAPDTKDAPSPSISLLGGMGTTNGSWAVVAGHKGIWKNDRIRYLGGGGYASINLDFYPTTGQLAGEQILFNMEGFGLIQEILFRTGSADFFIGPSYNLIALEVSFPLESEDVINIPDFKKKSRTAGAGLIAFYNAIDNEFTPDKGLRAEIEGRRYDSYFGGDYAYWKLELKSSGFIPLHENVILSLKGDALGTTDGAPFWDQPFISLRGIPVMRYIGEVVVVGEVEFRWDVTSRWSLVGFGGSGITADDVNSFDNGVTASSAGGGIRYFLARKFGMRAGFDFARGPEDWAFYITIGSAML